MDDELGIVVEHDPSLTPNIYPYKPVSDDVTGVRGSCLYFKERINITNDAIKLNYHQMTKR